MTSNKKARNTVNILGVKVDITTFDRVIEKIHTSCTSASKSPPVFIVTVNPEFVMQAQTDAEFRSILNSADLALADGVGLKYASWLLNLEHDLPVIPGRELVARLLEGQYKFFYLGGLNGVAERMADKYGGQSDPGHANIRTTNVSELAEADQRIIDKINLYQPDILLVAYGAPWQEKWLWANRAKIQAKVMLGVGGTFDYLTGDVKMPPKYIERYGLEWLWRLGTQPWRWRRQLNLIRFGWKIIFG